MRIAECLGLDTRRYQITNAGDSVEKEFSALESSIPDEERFRDACKLALRCRRCTETFDYEGLTKPRDYITAGGIVCVRCKAPLPVTTIAAQLECQIRAQTNKYYEAWLICSDSTCGNRTRQMSVYGKRCLGPDGLARGCSGRMDYEYSAKRLYNQLLYFSALFDVDRAKKIVAKAGGEKEVVDALADLNRGRFATLGGVVERYLEKCGRRWVNMESIFGFCAKGPAEGM